MKFQKIIKPLVILAALALILLAAFFAPERSVPAAPQMPAEPPVIAEPAIEEPIVEEPVIEETIAEEPMIAEPIAEQTPTEQPPAQPQCTISISCAELLSNMELLAEEKHALVPADGLLLPPTTISLTGGESVFDIILSAVRANALHMEYTASTTSYIEGVCNLYEFDAGPTSGWTYSVNGVFPNLDSSTYLVQDGDSIQLVYSLTPKTAQ